MNDDFSQKLNQVLSNPDMMAQIKALADTMTETGTQAENSVVSSESQQAFSNGDADHLSPIPEKISVPAFFSPSPSFDKNMKNTCELLHALKPFLDERRCAKIDKMLSMIQFAQMAGKLGNFF